MGQWLIPDAFWHSKSNGVFISHEAVCVLNTAGESAKLDISLYFEDRKKLDCFHVTIPAERTIHIRMDQLVGTGGEVVPQDTPYAIVLKSDADLSVQYTRVDTSQPQMAIATTIIKAIQ